MPLDDQLRLDDPGRALKTAATRSTGNRLFAFPAQSNFSGAQHSLALVGEGQRLGFDVLLDAAAFVPSNRISLREHEPEFVAISLYKIFGYPTGVGALVARRDALARLDHPWFAGGTVEYASVQNDLHRLKPEPEGFEDGTPNFLGLAALPAGFSFIESIGIQRLHDHVIGLTELFLDGLRRLTRPCGGPLTVDVRNGHP